MKLRVFLGVLQQIPADIGGHYSIILRRTSVPGEMSARGCLVSGHSGWPGAQGTAADINVRQNRSADFRGHPADIWRTSGGRPILTKIMP